jgi:PKD repeat protein
VSVTVIDGRGGSALASTSATVAEVNDTPVANASGAYSGVENEAVTFDASASSDFDNLDGTTANDQTLEYTWDFGDGSNVVTTTSATVDHAYSAAGSYNVSLTVSDGVVSSAAIMTTATISTPPSGSATDIYVWDIDFSTKRRGKHTDLRIFVDINSDSNADGLASSIDASAAGVLVTVELYNSNGDYVDTYTGTTDSSGVFQTSWIKGLASDTYTAEIVDLVHDTYDWNQLLDPNGDDEDAVGDGLPDDVFTLL